MVVLDNCICRQPSCRTIHQAQNLRYFRPHWARAAQRCTVRPRAQGPPEIGARDPTEAEITSNFTDKPLGFFDTSHVIRGPDGLIKLVGLGARSCTKGATEALTETEANKLRNQVPGWRLQKDSQQHLVLRQEWKVKDFKAGLELFNRVGIIAEEEGHHPDLHLEGYNVVAAELSTHTLGGLTDNDFIMAAKINAISFADLIQKRKPKFWA